MKKLGDFGSKEAAIERAQKLIDQHYAVIVHEYGVPSAEYAGAMVTRYVVWGTQQKTVMTGGWNR